ncbi:MAG: DEAD/DEAH box helicase, partial [Clostridia bacterium]|nr:DEAD/DEAH box helicase [Clostridia bacterium]
MGDDFSAFDSFSPFIKDFIYRKGWNSLHEMQVAAARIILETDDNLLLTSSTASGKTEAAFFPILSELYSDRDKIHGFGALYIAPLKSLINDQFERISELTEEADIPVYHWHGDVAASHKGNAVKDPRGILQITPESLESMLIRRSGDFGLLFGDLRYVVIDEIHTMTGTDRGNQVLCQLARLTEKTGNDPRRIGLSATVGDIASAARWLGNGSGRQTTAPTSPKKALVWRLGMEHFFINSTDTSDSKETAVSVTVGEASPDALISPECAENSDVYTLDKGFEYVYDCVQGKKSLVFSNSREETEYVTATLRQIARYRGDDDVFLIHHGNLSAAIREDAELKMKDSEKPTVTCATTTMELGIDIGKLERIIQVGAPNSVSSFLQRLGRSGRRGDPPEMMMVFREETPLPNAPLPELIPWELLRAIAVVQLYVEERFIEPPFNVTLPYSLLFHQTMSNLASRGGMTPSELASRVLSLPPFSAVTTDDYKTLLVSMINDDYLEMTDE